MPRPGDEVTLTPTAFDILLALLPGPAHGYAILQSVEELTEGRTTLHAGTLYRALARLQSEGLIDEAEGPDGTDERRRYYTVTRAGRDAAAAEAIRLEARLGQAREQGLLGA